MAQIINTPQPAPKAPVPPKYQQTQLDAVENESVPAPGGGDIKTADVATRTNVAGSFAQASMDQAAADEALRKANAQKK